jgi:hypothetical protein
VGIWRDLVGSTLGYFKLGIGGVRLKNNSGALAVRNSIDNADAAVTTSKLNNSGDSIDINSDAAGSGADWKMTIARPAAGMTAALTFTMPPNAGANGQALIGDGAGNFAFGSVGGRIAQQIVSSSGEVATTTTILPGDDTIPQNTEGGEFFTVTITPSNASSVLEIESLLFFSPSGASNINTALFVDTTANAIAAISSYVSSGGFDVTTLLKHYVSAGSTSARTYKIRSGMGGAGTLTLNGQSGARIFGGVAASYLSVREILP